MNFDRPACGPGGTTRKIIESGRARRNPKPWRAPCACGVVLQGVDREDADARLTRHLDGEF